MNAKVKSSQLLPDWLHLKVMNKARFCVTRETYAKLKMKELVYKQRIWKLPLQVVSKYVAMLEFVLTGWTGLGHRKEQGACN